MDPRIEKRARAIAAVKMGLVKDPWGERLPDELWKQCLPQAEREVIQLKLNRSNRNENRS